MKINAPAQKRYHKALQSGLEYNYTPCWGVHIACTGCGTLYPDMILTPRMLDAWDTSSTTRCCDSGVYYWKFVVGTRKGKVNLTVRSRVAAVQKRGPWAALCM